MKPAHRAEPHSGVESGFGMVEIVVSMFLIALMAVAVLPVMISSLKLTATNVLVSRATQVVSAQFDLARKQGQLAPTCSAIQGLATSTAIDIVDPNAEPLRYTRAVGACPTSYPGTVSVSVTVRQTSTGTQISTAKTLIVVSSAN